VEPSVVANLTGNLLMDCARQLTGTGEVPTTLVCSGMLESEIDEVKAAFAPIGLAESERRVENDWGALLLRRGASA